MKLFYRIDPSKYQSCMERIQEEFEMHKEVDEDKTILTLDDEARIVKVTGSFFPWEEDVAMVKVILTDDTLRGFFDSVLGNPYKGRG
ncbi:MAG: hypothetical protein ACE5H4_05055 [Candidatus Thorarchaeota archaeon]